ncbi:MAG: protein-glutamate O-methyltransferase CheR [Bacteroidetes bacterium]|nr:protein-glutamate O-methyltransferase CheR [Bacteroidota bacterium]
MSNEAINKSITDIREEISDEELKSLTVAIKTRYGIDFTNYEVKSLKRGIARLITKYNLGSLIGLWSKILKDREFLIGCIDDLLVNLTEMFRNPEIWEKIRADLMEQYKNKSTIKIWHAGCSTGEEIYTMAIVLSQAGLYGRADVTATDLSSAAMAKAMEGNYSSFLWKKYLGAFKQYFPGGKPEDFFEIAEDHVKVKESLKKNISFKKHNLVQDPMNKKFDVIFCRNVMIYFDEVLKMKVLNLFYNCLEPGGYLIIGYYDMLPEQSKELYNLYDPKTRIYVRK